MMFHDVSCSHLPWGLETSTGSLVLPAERTARTNGTSPFKRSLEFAPKKQSEVPKSHQETPSSNPPTPCDHTPTFLSQHPPKTEWLNVAYLRENALKVRLGHPSWLWFPNTPCMPYMPIHWGGFGGQCRHIWQSHGVSVVEPSVATAPTRRNRVTASVAYEQPSNPSGFCSGVKLLIVRW